jgi:HSP20 family protein
MRLKSLVPFRESGALMRPDFGLFGLHREIDRLFSEFAQGIAPNGTQNILRNRQGGRDQRGDAGA